MRVGDFSVEVVAANGGAVRELGSGHVLARPGQVYSLQLRNHGPLRAVADVTIDGHTVTGDGLVLDAWSTVTLERPIHETERGRFTVIAEGDERVFGPDGGRDNPDLGLIEARFRRELPSEKRRERPQAPAVPRPIVTMPLPPSVPPAPEPGVPPRRPFAPPEWTPPIWDALAARSETLGGRLRRRLDALMMPLESLGSLEAPAAPVDDAAAIERAAGTGLTGSSAQEFVPVHVGKLESEATVIQLRLVIASEDALSAPRPLPHSETAPARPAPRP